MTTEPSAGPSRALGLLLVALSLTAVTLVAYVIATRGQGTASDALMAASVDRSTLPVELPLRELGGAWVVDAAVEDDPPVAVALMLDTGAPTTILPELAERVGGEPVGAIEVVSVAGERALRDILPIGRVRLGAAVFDDVAAIEGAIPLDHPLRCITEDGLLGADAMSDAVWQLDPTRGRITIAPTADRLDHVDGAIRLPFTPSTDASPSPIVELPTASGRSRVVVDTGSDGWLAVHPDDFEAAGGMVAPDAPTRLATIWTTGRGPFTRIRYGTADVTLGSERVHDLPVATIEALEPGLGVMGTAFLRHFVLTIDWPGRVVHLDPIADGGLADLRPEAPLLATVGWDGRGLRVSSMVAVPEATDSGLELGLPVRAVDGRTASDLTLDEACALALAPPAPFRLTRSDGTTVLVGQVTDYLGSPA